MLSEQNGNWKKPQESGDIKVVSFLNTMVRGYVSNFDQIVGVDFRFHNGDELENNCFTSVIRRYIQLRKRDTFSDDDIVKLQKY